ncbi:MAG: phosphoribosylanthranilate isomerase [Dokdonella sp.]
MRIKICGITRAEDADAAVAAGVDALGFVLTRHSRRHVEPAEAAKIARALPPFISTVALFMDDDPNWIDEAIDDLNPDLLQFHGNESPEECERHACPYLKAVPMGSVSDVAGYVSAYSGATGLLLDANAMGKAGGSGHSFDWTRVPDLPKPMILAGGLDAMNVGRAIRLTRPYGVDVSSGIEISPGIKDARKMHDFVAAVRAANQP